MNISINMKLVNCLAAYLTFVVTGPIHFSGKISCNLIQPSYASASVGSKKFALLMINDNHKFFSKTK